MQLSPSCRLAGIGAGVGLAMSIATGYLLRWVWLRGGTTGTLATGLVPWRLPAVVARWSSTNRCTFGGTFPTLYVFVPPLMPRLPTAHAPPATLLSTVTVPCLSRWLRWRGAKPSVEITIILAVAYLSFYVGQSPAKVGRWGGWRRAAEVPEGLKAAWAGVLWCPLALVCRRFFPP